MSLQIVKPLTFIDRGNGYEYFVTSNRCLPVTLLKVYKDPVHRLLASYTTKGLVGSAVETEIDEANQGRILRLCSVPLSFWDVYYGKVLLVKMMKPIPIDFIFEGREGAIAFVKKGEVVSYEEALPEMPSDNPSAFLDEIIGKVNAIHSKASEHFEARGLSIENLKLNFGTESYGDGPLIPLWIGDGINPNKTAVIFNGNERITNCAEFAGRIIPPKIFKKEMAGNQANASPPLNFKNDS